MDVEKLKEDAATGFVLAYITVGIGCAIYLVESITNDVMETRRMRKKYAKEHAEIDEIKKENIRRERA